MTLAAGTSILLSAALPRRTGWVALALAVPNLVLAGTAFGGTDDTAFRAAGGTASVALGTVPWLLRIVVVGVVVIRDREEHRRRARSVAAT